MENRKILLLRRISHAFRRKRMKAFEEFYFEQIRGGVSPSERNITVLDVGGTLDFWKSMNFKYFDTASIELLNLRKIQVPESYRNVTSIAGDATDMHQYADKSFDLVFSNSVIEHVGDYEAQKKMAAEIRRIGKHYYLQTPNRNFLMEPHFLFPFFHFLPVKARMFLVKRMKLGVMPKAKNDKEALEIVQSVRLMTEKELRTLFPQAEMHKEKFLFMTKSYTLWE